MQTDNHSSTLTTIISQILQKCEVDVFLVRRHVKIKRQASLMRLML